jgi:hypothetical protein
MPIKKKWGTRSEYTPEHIRVTRVNRKLTEPKVEGVPAISYQYALGNLMAMGHGNITGLQELTIKPDVMDNDRMEINIRYRVRKSYDGLGDMPHIVGYLVSGHPNDPRFRVKMWINDDNTIRIELTQ